MLKHESTVPEARGWTGQLEPQGSGRRPSDAAQASVAAEAARTVHVEVEPRSLAPDRDGAESAWRIAYGALDLARLVSGAPWGALLACEGEALRLLAARGTEQRHLDVAHAAWTDPGSGLARGRVYAHRQPPFVALPCVDGVVIVGVLLLAWESPEVQAAGVLMSLSRVLGASLRRLGVTGGSRPGGVACATPGTAVVPDTHALALLVTLEEHEWNVSRVARVLEVTRMTIYNRMRAAGIKRGHVRKSRQRKRQPGTLPDSSAPPCFAEAAPLDGAAADPPACAG